MSFDLAILTEVDGARMMDRLAQMATRVKLSGTDEERESLDTLRTDLDAFGFATRVIEHEAYISLPGAARIIHNGRDLPCITHSMGTSTAGLEGQLVYVGLGREAEFAAADVAGRIALIDGIALEDTTLCANRAGAIAQVQISPQERLHEMCVSPVWGNPGPRTREALPRLPIVSVPASEGAALKAMLAGGEPVSVRIETQVDTGWRSTPILEAEMGCDDGAPFVMLSGHHDTWHFGVMDNGAANVTMLEVARLLAARQKDWARGLRICFWSGHSHGRYSSSAWYADAHWQDLADRCIAHVNVDSTGGSGAITLAKSGVSAQLAGLVAKAVERESGETHLGRRQGRAADQSFWGIGIASAFGSISHEAEAPEGRPVALGPYWHTPDDLIDFVDEANLARDTRVVIEVLGRLVCDAVPPIDHGRWCEDLAAELDAIKPHAIGLDLCPAETALKSLRAALVLPLDEDALRRIGHHLIPLDHTEGDRFSHDAALPRAPWPLLAPLRDLATGAPQDVPFHCVPARQALNRITHALREATRAAAH